MRTRTSIDSSAREVRLSADRVTLRLRTFCAVLAMWVSACCSEPELDTAPMAPDGGPVGPTAKLFVDPGDLAGMDALLVDARSFVAFHAGHLPKAVHAPWTDFVESPMSGTLTTEFAVIERQMRDLGMTLDRTIIVYGDWNYGWGEEGRLFWMLQYLGHRDVRVLAGGLPRWRALAGPTQTLADDVPAGDFHAVPRTDVRAATQDVLDVVNGRSQVVLLDVRTREEFEGSTPYGSARGGRIPGARHLHWKDLFAPSGQLRSLQEIREILGGLGIRGDTKVITYCTGGVRSAFVYLVLTWSGIVSVRNYDGSWWEWSARDELPIEKP